MSERTLVIHHSKFQNFVWALAYLLVAVAVGYIFLTAEEESGRRFWIGLFFVAILLVPAISHGWAVLDGRPQIVIDDEGVKSTAWEERGLVRWEEMESVRLQGMRALGTKLEIVVKRREVREGGPKFETLLLELRHKDQNARAVLNHIGGIPAAKQLLRRGMLMMAD